MNAVQLDKLYKTFVLKKGKGFGRTHQEVVAVDNVNLSVEQGQSVAFIGPNGAGKSTTIKMLTGILHPSGGSAHVLGYVPWAQRRQLARNIGVVFGQRSQLWYHLPPDDTFDLLARIYDLDKHVYLARKQMLIDRFDLGSFVKTPVRKLSLGQRMRAEVAASLLHQPKVIFLDEPTIGLDVVARQELRDLLRDWNRDDGLTIFLTSHDAGDIESVSKRAIVINHGSVVFDDKVSTLRRRYLGAKVLSLKFHELPQSFSMPGVNVVKANGYALKLEVDTNLIEIEQVIQRLLKSGPVADITIEDPPLEEVIAHIYGQSKDESLRDFKDDEPNCARVATSQLDQLTGATTDSKRR